MTAPESPPVTPGTILEHPMNAELVNKRYAIKTGIDLGNDSVRSWFIYDIENGGWYAPGSECAGWPPYTPPAPASEGEDQ